MKQASPNPFVTTPDGVQVFNAPAAHPHAQRRHGAQDYSQAPMNVYWETTQACALACRHCRAEAVCNAHPNELTRGEGMGLLRQIAAFEPKPHLVLTGGDPMQRADIYDLIDESRALGIMTSITPSATAALTFEVMEKLKAHKIDSMGLSLDGSNARRHEAVRGVEGCFEWTIQAAKNAEKLGIPIQVNTLVAEETVDDLPAIYELLKTFKVMRWSLFFLIAVGRGKVLQPITPEHGEEVMNWAFDLSRTAPFTVATTEAPSYRRVALDRMRKEGMVAAEIERSPVYRGFGIRDGHGVVFIGNQGDVCPAGFLPLTVGNVRQDSLVDLYRNAPVFRALHAPRLFKGKCGRCEYTTLCGGSRARAFAYTGDPLESDPFCAYEPKSSEPKEHGVSA